MNLNLVALWQRAARYEPLNPTARAFLRGAKTSFINALSLVLTVLATAIYTNGFINIQIVLNGAIVAGISVLIHTGAKLFSASNDPIVKVVGMEAAQIANDFDSAHPAKGVDPLQQNTAIQTAIQNDLTNLLAPTSPPPPSSMPGH